MTENKLFKQTAFFVFFGLMATPALAQNSMMGLAFVDEILIQTPRLGNPVDSRKCELSENDISNYMLKKLTADAIPAFSLIDAPPLNEKKARIFVVPEITTMEIKDVACLSYVSLTAKSQAAILVPPVPIPRNVTVTYWSAGLMVNSSRAGHPRTIEGGLEKLVELFAREYRLAQPPLVSLETEKKP